MNTCMKWPCSMNMTSGHCYDTYCPFKLNQAPAVQPAPMGCICPPGANLTCEASMCPRKGIRISGASSHGGTSRDTGGAA